MGTSLAFHAYPLTYGLVSLPFQWLIEDVPGLVVALNGIILLSFVFSGFGAYLLASHVTGSRLAGWVAGIIFAFMPFHSLNRVTLHLLAIEFIPFYILSLLRLSEEPTPRRAILMGLWLALTYYSSLEYALYLFMFSGLWSSTGSSSVSAKSRENISWHWPGLAQSFCSEKPRHDNACVRYQK